MPHAQCSISCVSVCVSARLQYIFLNVGFNQPFFMTYLSIAVFVVLLPVQLVKERCSGEGTRTPPAQVWQVRACICVCMCAAKGIVRAVWCVCVWVGEREGEVCARNLLPPVCMQAAKYAGIITPLWVGAAVMYNGSLSSTSVSSSMVLSTSSCVFTLLFGVPLLGESATLMKILGVLLTCVSLPPLALSCFPPFLSLCSRFAPLYSSHDPNCGESLLSPNCGVPLVYPIRCFDVPPLPPFPRMRWIPISRLGGVVLLGYEDKNSGGSNKLFGDALCIGSAFMFALSPSFAIFRLAHFPSPPHLQLRPVRDADAEVHPGRLPGADAVLLWLPGAVQHHRPRPCRRCSPFHGCGGPAGAFLGGISPFSLF